MSEAVLTQIRKPRSNSALNRLTPEQKNRLRRWLVDENKGYDAVQGLLAAEFGVKTSRSALGRYYQRMLAPRWLGPVMSGE